MTLIVEDGTGKADAETLCDVDFFKSYCASRGLSITGLDDERIAILLRQASDFMLGYGDAWQGCRVNGVQALDWPRKGVVANGFAVAADAVPLQVQRACALLAYKAKSGPLVRDLKQAKTKVKVGSLETEFDPTSNRQTIYADVAVLLAPFFATSNPYSIPLGRS